MDEERRNSPVGARRVFSRRILLFEKYTSVREVYFCSRSIQKCSPTKDLRWLREVYGGARSHRKRQQGCIMRSRRGRRRRQHTEAATAGSTTSLVIALGRCAHHERHHCHSSQWQSVSGKRRSKAPRRASGRRGFRRPRAFGRQPRPSTFSLSDNTCNRSFCGG